MHIESQPQTRRHCAKPGVFAWDVQVGKHHILNDVRPSRCQMRPKRLKSLQLHASHVASVINNHINGRYGLNQLIPKGWIFLVSNPNGRSVIFKFTSQGTRTKGNGRSILEPIFFGASHSGKGAAIHSSDTETWPKIGLPETRTTTVERNE